MRAPLDHDQLPAPTSENPDPAGQSEVRDAPSNSDRFERPLAISIDALIRLI